MHPNSPIIDPNFYRKEVKRAKRKERVSLIIEWTLTIAGLTSPFVALHLMW